MQTAHFGHGFDGCNARVFCVPTDPTDAGHLLEVVRAFGDRLVAAVREEFRPAIRFARKCRLARRPE